MNRIIFILFSFLFFCDYSSAKDIGGIILPNTYTFEKDELVLNGCGLRKKFGFQAYACGLYIKNKTQNWEAIVNADEPMVVRLHFLRDIPYDKVALVWNDSFSAVLNKNLEPFKEQIDKFNSFFKNGAVKDEIWDVLYTPGKGVNVDRTNGTTTYSMGQNITGFDFKKVVFSIWLAPKTNDLKLRNGLMGIEK